MVSAESQIETLVSSKAQLGRWIQLANEHYEDGRHQDFLKVLEAANLQKFDSYEDFDQDYMLLLDSLAAYYVQLGHKQRDLEKRKDYYAKATQMYNNADKIIMYDENHLLGRAYFLLLEGEKLSQADSQFNFVINQNPKNIKALIGKSYIYFHKKDYKAALNVLKKALRINPQGPADIRVGMGHAFFKLGNTDKARLAYERALEIDSRSSQALLGLALIELNVKTAESTRRGVEYLSKAYQLDPSNPMILNLLADHFFYKKDFEKVKKLSLQAFHHTENEPTKAESSFQLARVFHCQKNYEVAYQYYYQSVQYAHPSYLHPYFGLAQMYVHKKEYENTLSALAKILKHDPDCVQALKLQAYTLKQMGNPSDMAQVITNYNKVLKGNPKDLECLIGVAQATENSNYQQAIDCYLKADDILKSNTDGQFTDEISAIAPQEFLSSVIQNNIACLNFLLGKYEQSFDLIESVKSTTRNRKLKVLAEYNSAIVCEQLEMNDISVDIYNQLIKDNNMSVLCHLRLGLIAMKNGDYSEAKDQFNEAIHLEPNNLDALTLQAQMHEANMELSLAQKTFQKILEISPKDTYALLSLGNIFLATAHHHQSGREADKVKRHLDCALNYYKTVLKHDNNNVYAANGIGAVFAHRGFLNEARDVFSQVKETFSNSEHIWMNLAHSYLELKQFGSAYKMYETGLHKFYDMTATNILTYIAKALYRSGDPKKAFLYLQKVCIIEPSSVAARYNLASITQAFALQIMTRENSSVESVNEATEMLNVSLRNYSQIQKEASQTKSFRIDSDHLQMQINHTRDLISQAETYREIANQREIERLNQIEGQIKQLEKIEKEREAQIKLERDRELELAAKKDEMRNEVIKRAQQNVEAIKQRAKKGNMQQSQESTDIVNEDQTAEAETGQPANGQEEEAYTMDDEPEIPKEHAEQTNKPKIEVGMVNSDDEQLPEEAGEAKPPVENIADEQVKSDSSSNFSELEEMLE